MTRYYAAPLLGGSALNLLNATDKLGEDHSPPALRLSTSLRLAPGTACQVRISLPRTSRILTPVGGDGAAVLDHAR
jgi:hypothetical protein